VDEFRGVESKLRAERSSAESGVQGLASDSLGRDRPACAAHTLGGRCSLSVLG